jgi:aryl-alcohol dehydrogenase-like predicted oxidoreductase
MTLGHVLRSNLRIYDQQFILEEVASDRGIQVRYRSFGKTGWNVSEIGIGTWQIGGSWGTRDDPESVKTLLLAFERGINYVDTAPGYGNGHSEELIGRALKLWKGSRIYVATKVPPTRWPSPEDDCPAMRGRYPSRYLREQIEQSLFRLEVECLDLLQLHCWAPDGLECLDWLETLNKLRPLPHVLCAVRV